MEPESGPWRYVRYVRGIRRKRHLWQCVECGHLRRTYGRINEPICVKCRSMERLAARHRCPKCGGPKGSPGSAMCVPCWQAMPLPVRLKGLGLRRRPSTRMRLRATLWDGSPLRRPPERRPPMKLEDLWCGESDD